MFPTKKRINEDKVTLSDGDEEYVNVLDISKDISDAHNESIHDTSFNITIKPDTPINVYTRFCLNTAKSKFSLVSPVTD